MEGGFLTTAKRLGLASVALIGLGASAAYYATVMAMKGYAVPRRGLDCLVFGLVAALTVLVLLVFWRSVHRDIGLISVQLAQMARTGQVGMLMANGTHELKQIIRPLNDFLSTNSKQLDSLRAENRELQIQARIAAAEKSHTEAIIFSISDAVIVTNRFDELVLANEAAERLFGFKLASSQRKTIDRVVPDGTLVRLIRETRSHGRNFPRKVVEHTIESKGLPRTYTVTLSCVVAPPNEVAGVVAVLHDVTREKEIARMKTDFVSNVSHELKTPITAVKGALETLLEGALEEDPAAARRFLEVAARHSDRLASIIDDLLSLSRLEQQEGAALEKQECVLEGIARGAMQVCQDKADARRVSLELQAEAGLVAAVNSQLLEQALTNLIDNAIKYSNPGSPVDISVRRTGAGIALTVRDRGIGIPKQDLPRVFERFYRVDKARSRELGGTGLGLAIVKHIVLAHGGTVQAESEPGAGSAFTIELPA